MRTEVGAVLAQSLLVGGHGGAQAGVGPVPRPRRPSAPGPANHVVADPPAEATACAKRIAGLPRQAAESTKRILSMDLEHAVLATLDYATSAEEQSFQNDCLRDTPARLTGK